jgi:hypothetical protein
VRTIGALFQQPLCLRSGSAAGIQHGGTRVSAATARVVRAATALTYGRGHYGYLASRVVVTRPVAMS